MLTVKRDFPLDTIQSGAMLGNGKTGVTIWGGGNRLNITLGCADLWDHRGGMEWTPEQSFRNVRAALESGDENAIRKLFSSNQSGTVRRPSLIPVGRLVITLPKSAVLLRYEQELEHGLTRIVYDVGNGWEKSLLFYPDMSMYSVLAGFGLDSKFSLKLISSWELCQNRYAQFQLSEHDQLAERGFTSPSKQAGTGWEGFIQPMPADPSFAMFYRRGTNSFTLGFERGTTDLEKAVGRLQKFETVKIEAKQWWADYWQDTPSVSSGDPDIDELYWHGLYKYGIMTAPDGAVPGLQGPWIEDDRLPPWQGDYHFNINVQMCHMPGYKAGKFANLRKLFDMVLSWKEKLRNNARFFAGIDNGYLLPHAVDDRGVCMGSFWSGTIDHACSAWIAMMMFDYCDYTGDLDYLKNHVYDFMLGVWRVYEVMLETGPDGVPSLPVSVSPEYRGSAIDAWGRNASFQLAAIHRLLRNLILAAELLGMQPEDRWLEIERKLPAASICNGEIAVWDGLLLEESHRHHSHLAAICPFDVIDPLSDEWKPVMEATMERWIRLGMGQWTGWCMSWASQIHTRLGNGDMAGLLLKIWKDYFTGPGGGSFHDGRYKGFSIFADIRGEIMQMDGCMGTVNAIQDQFLFSCNGILRIFFGIGQRAKNISFSRLFAPGGLRISGRIEKDGTIRITAEATRDTMLRIQTRTSPVFEREMAAGEKLDLIQTEENILIPED
jgi:hypothetical protein